MTHDGSFGIWGVHPDNDPDYVPEACPFCSGTGRIKIADDAGDGLAYDICSACQGTGSDE